MKNNYLYQGAFSELDDDIGWTDFALRNYDAQIGRWVQQDPYEQFASPYLGMGDDPVNGIDPSGGIYIAPLKIVQAAAGGAAITAKVLQAVGQAGKAVSLLSKVSIVIHTVLAVINIINTSITSVQVGRQANPGNYQGIRPFAGSEIENLVTNAREGLNTPGRNGPLDCLNAFASNIKALYGDNAPDKCPTDGTMSTALAELEGKGLARLKQVVQPKVDGKRLTSRSHNGSDYYDGNHFTGDIQSNILETITKHTGYENIGVFAVGPGAQYHSIIIVVVTNPKFTMTDANGKSYQGSQSNPYYLMIEDSKGVTFGNAAEINAQINPYITGARAYYRGELCPGGKCFPHPEKNTDIGTTIYDLFQKL